MTLSIKTVELTKYFYPRPRLRQWLLRREPTSPRDRIIAVDRVNLEVRQGELFGLLGPNGAGKTTLVKILATLILPNAGSATVAGHNLAEEEKVRAAIGLINGEERSFYWRLSGRQNLEFYATLHGFTPAGATRQINRLAGLLDMVDFIDRRFDSYSSGMKQRLGIARGLLNDPQLLFLDEPTKSLDPNSAARLRETVRTLVDREGYTVVLVTHQLHEAEELCDRIAIMHRGRIRVTDDITRLRQMLRPEKQYRFKVAGLPAQATGVLADLEGVTAVETGPLDGAAGLDLTVHLLENGNGTGLAGVIETIVSQGGRISDVGTDELSLEEIFKKYTEATE